MPGRCELEGVGAPYKILSKTKPKKPEMTRTPCHPVPGTSCPLPCLTPVTSEQIVLEKTDRSQELRFKPFFIAQQQMKLFTYT